MRFILTLLFEILMISAISQTHLDSLFEKINSSTDQEKVDIYLAIAKQNWRLSTDSIYKYSKKALDLSQDIKYLNGEAQALSYIGVTYFYKAQYDSVLYYYNAAIDKFKETNNMAAAAITINNKGVLYKRLGNFEKSIECYNEAKRIHEENKDYRELGGTYLNIGNVYDIQNNFDKAMEYYFLALNQFEEIDDKIKIASALTNIGEIHSDLNQDSIALDYYERAVVLQKEENDIYGMANTLANIGIQHKKLKNYSLSVDYLNQSLDLFQKMKDQDAIAWIYNNLGVLYGLMKQWEEAKLMYDKTVEITQQIGDDEGLGYVKYDLGEMYFFKNDWNKAEINLKEGIKLAGSLNMSELLEKSYLLLSRVDSAKGNYLKSREHYKLYSQFKDTIFNRESDRNIAEMQTKYETSKKEQQIELLQQEKSYQELKLKKNKIIGLISIVGILILFSLILVWNRSRQRKREEEVLLKNTMETEDKERKRLAEELHDGIGPLLSTVKMYINEIEEVNNNSSEKELLIQSDQIIDEAINSARTLSHNLMPHNIENDGLIKSLQTFINRLNMNNNLEVNLNSIDLGEYGLWQQVMIYRIITELMNNTIKHSNANKIDIQFQKTNKILKITYSDNGQGFDVDKVLKNGGGIGLKNIISRVNSLKGKVNFKSSGNKGFKAIINIGITHLLK